MSIVKLLGEARAVLHFEVLTRTGMSAIDNLLVPTTNGPEPTAGRLVSSADLTGCAKPNLLI